MDDSEEMIKMCEEADELRRSWKPTTGDWIYEKYTFQNHPIFEEPKRFPEKQVIIDTYEGHFLTRNKYGSERMFRINDIPKGVIVWLPSQERLQGLLEEKDPIMVHADFSRFVDVWLDRHQRDIEPTTMTRLWLEYVMKKNYNKIWVNGGWV